MQVPYLYPNNKVTQILQTYSVNLKKKTLTLK